jgi:hypothetical protein
MHHTIDRQSEEERSLTKKRRLTYTQLASLTDFASGLTVLEKRIRKEKT